jgi:hypothetical protein
MANLTVMVMELNVFMVHGNVMTTQTVQTVLTKLIALLHHVQIKVYGIVAMANVFQHHTFVMV